MTDTNTIMTKLNTAVAVLLDAKQSMESWSGKYKIGYNTPDVQNEDSAESVVRRLTFVREKLNEINKALKDTSEKWG